MAIADTITSMYENVGDVYDTLSNVEVNTGKNLIQYVTDVGERLEFNGKTTTDYVWEAGTYTISFDRKITSGFGVFAKTANSGNVNIGNTSPITITMTEPFAIWIYGTDISTNDIVDIMFEKGSIAHEYEPYTPTPTYKNIENIPKVIRKSYLNIMNNGYQDIWDSWDKVNGSGTSLSLNNTEEAPMSLTYKGNTYQYQKNAENYFSPTNIRDSGYLSSPQYFRPIAETGTTSGTLVSSENVTLSWNNTTKKLSISGSWASASPSYLSVLKIGEIPAGTYTLTLSTGAIKYMQLSTESVGGTTLCSISKNGTSATFTISEPTVAYLGFNFSEGTYDVEYSFNLTDGIVTPSPDYPSPVQTVSGDNSIEVVGKNLVEGKIENYYVSSNGTFLSGAYDMQIARVVANNTYTITTDQSGLVAGFFTSYPTISSTSYNGSRIVETNKTFIAPISGYIAFRTGHGYEYPQLELGNQATTSYEPYQGASYPISLKSKNLFDLYGDKTITNCTASIENTKLSQKNTSSYARTEWLLSGFTVGQKYTISSTFTNANGSSLALRVYDSNNSTNIGSSGNITDTSGIATLTFTATETSHYFRFYSNTTSTSNTYTVVFDRLQLEKGEEPTNYEKYYDYGELCKIGTYQDKIDKSTGKNLFDYSTNILNNANFGGGSIVADNSCILSYCECKPNTTYTISRRSPKTIRFMVATTQTTPSIGVSLANVEQFYDDTTTSITFTTGANDKYIVTRFIYNEVNNYDTYAKTIQVEKGNQATSYEPYGTDWYLKKEIGKVVFNGTETWWNATQILSSDFYRYENQDFRDTTKYMSRTKYVSNYFKFSNNNNTTENIIVNTNSEGLNRLWIIIDTTYMNGTTENDFKNWLSNNNTTVYYVLATPTYETITDTTLLSQLEEAKKSYESQTNISQENNDLPFELAVVALSDGTVE